MSATEAIARLRELRAKATAGPWAPIQSNYDNGTFYCHRPRMSVQFHDIEDQYDRLDFANAAAIVAAMNSLESLLACAAQLEKLTEAASCIRHWHDAMADGSGMVVSAEHVRKLWDATEEARAALQALAEGGGE